jgi:very-short-patch-repair endonuclease
MIVLKSVTSGRTKGQIALPYQREPVLFTPAERSFLGVLEQAVEGQFRIFGKVRLADIIRVKSGVSAGARQQAFNRIQSKHIDFVLCKPRDLSVQFVVELDDSSHQAPRRQARDEFLDDALKAAGIPLLHFRAQRTYSVPDIREALSAAIPNPLAE